MFTDTDTAKHNKLNKRQHMTVTTSNTQDTICVVVVVVII